MTSFLKTYSFLVVLFFLTACDKGYKVRVANYYVETLDSVVIGNNKIVFTGIESTLTTDFKGISKGKYSVTFISKKKKKFYTELHIPSTGTGQRTLQIDAIEQVSVLEE